LLVISNENKSKVIKDKNERGKSIRIKEKIRMLK